MNKLIALYAQGFSNDNCFQTVNVAHKFAPTDFYTALKGAFNKKGFEVHTADLVSSKATAAEIYIEGQEINLESSCPKFLLAYENPVINTKNQETDYFKKFTGVVTWNPEMQHCKNVSLMMVPNHIAVSDFKDFDQRDVFISLINSNKGFSKPVEGDLYKERVKLIRFLEERYIEKFHLYGHGWDKPEPTNGRIGKLNRAWVRLKTKTYGFRPFPSYKGTIESKHSVYSRTKFAICYENIEGLENYITEKIFDAFFAGCVPIYWGAPNVLDYIPASTFIDRREFSSNEHLLQFLNSITPDRYKEFQTNIKNFLTSEAIKIFCLENHVKKVSDLVCAKIQPDGYEA